MTVCRLGSLLAAVAELNHSQSAISRQIAGLERQLGMPLMERHGIAGVYSHVTDLMRQKLGDRLQQRWTTLTARRTQSS